MAGLLARVLFGKECFGHLPKLADIELNHLDSIEVVELKDVLLVGVGVEEVFVALSFLARTLPPEHKVDPAGQLFGDLLRL